MNELLHFKRRKLVAKVERLLEKTSNINADFRKNLLSILNDYYSSYFKKIQKKFFSDKNGLESGQLNSKLADIIVLTSFEAINNYMFPQPNPTTSDKLSILAIGGYGRGHLSPGSDIDLLVLTPYKLIPRTEQIVETLLYILWDMKLKVGYSVRNINETISKAKIDNTVCTSLLEARFIVGNSQLWDSFCKDFQTKILNTGAKKFFYAKIKERELRYKRMGDSQYLLEPNIKEGKGGLRDIHIIKWIIYFTYKIKDQTTCIEKGILSEKDSRTLSEAEKFLINIRTIMHYKSKSFSDRLTFDLQTEAAQFQGYSDKEGLRASELLMKQYYLHVRSISYLSRKILEFTEIDKFKSKKSNINKFLSSFIKNRKGVYEIIDGKIYLQKKVKILSPMNIIKVFHLMIDNNLIVSSSLLNLIQENTSQIDKIKNDKKANNLFMDILLSQKNAEIILRSMNETGVLGRFIPDFGRVVAQIQHDMYHVFTVDEHTLNAIGILRRVYNEENNNKLSNVKKIADKIISRKILTVALFLHDIAKGRGKDHSILGAQIAEKLCPRLGLLPDEVETVAWLVKNHLLMSNVAFKRDINDIETIRNFCLEIQSIERLRLLYVLTVVDIDAVGPNIWNSWKDNLLNTLFEESVMIINGGGESKSRKIRIEQAKEVLKNKFSSWSDEKFKKHINRFYSYYWTNVDFDVQERHATLIENTDQNSERFAINFYSFKKRKITEVSIYMQDHHGLFARMSAGLALAGTSILDGRIVTTKDGMAINTFLINISDLENNKNRLNVFKNTIFKTVFEERSPKDLFNEFKNVNKFSRKDVIKIEPRVLVDNFSSKTHTIVEINAKDKIGLLSSVAAELFIMGLQISTARISTYGLRAVDVFYIQDMTGMKVTNNKKLNTIKLKLMLLLTDKEFNSLTNMKNYTVAK